jgi:hypothetical protein
LRGACWAGIARVLAALAGAAWPGLAQAAPIVAATAEIEAAGGHDDNMFLSATPDGLGTLLRLGGGYVSAAPALGVDVAAARWRVRLAYLGDFRAADAVGRLDTHLIDLRAWLPAWDILRANVALFGGHFGATQFPADQYLFGGGEVGLRAALGERFAVATAVRAEVRALAADASGTQSRDWLLAPSLRAPWQALPWLEIAPVASFVQVSSLVDAGSDAAVSRFRRTRAGIDATASAGIVTVSAGGWGGRIGLGDVAETHVGGRVELRLDVDRNLQLFALADLVRPVSTGASDHYARQLFSLGITGRLSAHTGGVARTDGALDLRPRVQPTGVRFRLAARGATSVTLVGSWDDWTTPGRALIARDGGATWEIVQPLPRGAHRYHFLVDGQARRPPDAPRYVPDGFDSEDGVVDVDAAIPGGAP